MALILMSAPQTVRKICCSKSLHGTQESIFVFYVLLGLMRYYDVDLIIMTKKIFVNVDQCNDFMHSVAESAV